MKIKITGKNITITDGIKSAIEKQFSKLDKYINRPKDARCNILVRTYKVGAKIEATIFIDKKIILRAEEKADTLYIAIGQIIDKLKKQILTIKGKRMSHRDNFIWNSLDYDNVENSTDEFEPEELIKRVKDVLPERFNTADAIIKMEALGHSFFVYIDDNSGITTVLYKREDGGYGQLRLIEWYE